MQPSNLEIHKDEYKLIRELLEHIAMLLKQNYHKLSANLFITGVKRQE
jgi:hypothetical protein